LIKSAAIENLPIEGHASRVVAAPGYNILGGSKGRPLKLPSDRKQLLISFRPFNRRVSVL